MRDDDLALLVEEYFTSGAAKEDMKMTNAKQIQQAMTVRNHAASLLVDHEDQPVDASSLAQETGLTEKQVTQSLKYLVREDLIEMDGGKVIAVLPMFTEAQQ